MKLIKIYNQIIKENKLIFNEVASNDPCECCQYFDFSFKQAGAYYGGLNHPLYHELEKDIRHELRYIQPEAYMRAIARGFGMSYDDAMNSNAIDKGKVKAFVNSMKNGDKFPIGYYTKNSGSQEGRHRALALMSIGCDEMPVVVMSQVHYGEKKEIVNKYRDYSREQLNQEYINKGYEGISDLDWRTIRAFVDYNRLGL